jgi:hypothetical protein
MLRHVAPAVERDLHQLGAALGVVVILEGEDAELRADGGAPRSPAISAIPLNHST